MVKRFRSRPERFYSGGAFGRYCDHWHSGRLAFAGCTGMREKRRDACNAPTISSSRCLRCITITTLSSDFRRLFKSERHGTRRLNAIHRRAVYRQQLATPMMVPFLVGCITFCRLLRGRVCTARLIALSGLGGKGQWAIVTTAESIKFLFVLLTCEAGSHGRTRAARPRTELL